MKIGYMTNAWGSTSGTGGGVTSIKDLLYISAGLEPNVFADIKSAGFDNIEIFEGNLINYGQDIFGILKDNALSILTVYTGANFIFDEILPAELYRIEKTCEAAANVGAKYLNIGGGAIRYDGIQEDDYKKLGAALSKVNAIAKKYSLTACYHPHLGTISTSAEQIDKVFGNSDVAFCPDCGHLQAGGNNAADLIEKYVSRIPYVHLKDYDGKSFAPLGTGVVDFDRVFAVLKSHPEIDFTVEAERIADPLQRAIEAKAFIGRYNIF